MKLNIGKKTIPTGTTVKTRHGEGYVVKGGTHPLIALDGQILRLPARAVKVLHPMRKLLKSLKNALQRYASQF